MDNQFRSSIFNLCFSYNVSLFLFSSLPLSLSSFPESKNYTQHLSPNKYSSLLNKIKYNKILSYHAPSLVLLES